MEEDTPSLTTATPNIETATSDSAALGRIDLSAIDSLGNASSMFQFGNFAHFDGVHVLPAVATCGGSFQQLLRDASAGVLCSRMPMSPCVETSEPEENYEDGYYAETETEACQANYSGHMSDDEPQEKMMSDNIKTCGRQQATGKNKNGNVRDNKKGRSGP